MRNQPVSEKALAEFINNTTVALMAGGQSSRFQSVPGSDKTNKNSYQLPNGDTMIEMTIRMYAKAGFKNFTALVYHKAQTISKLLGKGEKYGVNIKYSYDPEKPVGKGGAVLNALLNGSIPETHNLIVHNPDDVIINYNGSFPQDIAKGHLNGTQKGMFATVVVVEETPYPYTGMQIKDSVIEKIEMYPMIPIPTHIGVTVFSPKCYSLFGENFDLEHKSDFESVLFPIIAKKRKLYAVSIASETWLAVNNLKAYKELVRVLKDNP